MSKNQDKYIQKKKINLIYRPLQLAAKWPRLVTKYGFQTGADDEEPVLYFRRNVFLTRHEEELIKEPKILELLYAEARHNVLEGKKNQF